MNKQIQKEQQINLNKVVGEIINPKPLQTTFAPIPSWLIRRPELSFGAKVLYARLVQFANQNGVAWPTRKQLAEELGISTDQIDVYVKELVSYGLIHVKQIGLRLPNQYYFLYHVWMGEGCAQNQEQPQTNPTPESAKMPTPESAKMPTPESAKMPTPESAKMPTPYPIKTTKNNNKENTHKRSVCVPSSNRSKFNFEQCKRYAKTQKSIKNPDGWATMAIKTGMYDKEIEAYEIYLAQEEQKVKEAEDNAKKHREDFIAYMLLRAAENPLRNDEIGWLRHVGYTGDLVSL